MMGSALEHWLRVLLGTVRLYLRAGSPSVGDGGVILGLPERLPMWGALNAALWQLAQFESECV